MKTTQKATNPYKNSDCNKRYYTMDYHMRKVFGGKACKVPIDGGFTCPNRDGTKGVGGCTFCSSRGSGDFTAGRSLSITEQIDRGAEMMHKKWKDAALIPYFQAFTSTYAPLSELKKKYEEALAHPLARGLCIATRPDCITEETAIYLKSLAKNHFIMVELGLQTTFDETAKAINRGHLYEDFLRGYRMLDGLFVCVHLINGLPGETHEMMVENARRVSELKPSAVKLHLLHILKDTEMAESFRKNEFEAMTLSDYVTTVCDQLEVLPSDTVIERVTGDGSPDTLIAPMWSIKKLVVQNEIDKLLFARNSYQGIHCKPKQLL